MLQELGEVRDDDVGAVLEQGLPLSGAVDSDNEAEVPGAPRLDSRQCVLEDGRFGRLDADLLRRREERVGRRLSLQVPLLDGDPVDADLEQVLDPGGLEDVLAVRAGGHDGSVEPRLANRMDVPHRPVVGLDAVAFQKCHHELVLAVSETVDGLGRRRVVRIALGQLDSARGQERANAVVARLAVDVPVVVGDRVEGGELLAGSLGALAQVRVEHLLPGGGVHLGGRGEDAVEIEEAGADPARQPKPLRVAGHEQTVQNKGPIRNGDPTEASLAMPTWRSWRLCRRDRLNPAGSAKAGPIRNGDPTEASLAMPTWRSWRLCRRDRLDPAGVAKGGPIRNGDPTKASLATPTWRPWRLCRRGRLNPAEGESQRGPAHRLLLELVSEQIEQQPVLPDALGVTPVTAHDTRPLEPDRLVGADRRLVRKGGVDRQPVVVPLVDQPAG